MNQDVKHLVTTMEIILGGTTKAPFQQLVPGVNVNFGIQIFHIDMINQKKSTTFAVIRTVRMVVFGVIQRILMSDGNTVMFQV